MFGFVCRCVQLHFTILVFIFNYFLGTHVCFNNGGLDACFEIESTCLQKCQFSVQEARAKAQVQSQQQADMQNFRSSLMAGPMV